MSSLTGNDRIPHSFARRGPLAGEIGHLASCPLCIGGKGGTPPCLACRDELRARLLDMYAVGFPADAALN